VYDKLKDMKKSYKPEFKAKVVLEILREELTISQISSKYEVHPNQIARWKKAVMEGIPELLEDKRRKDVKEEEYQALLQELYAQIGELTTKLNWIKKIWHRH
jgi:putative transposase